MGIKKELVNKVKKLPKVEQDAINKYMEKMIAQYELRCEIAEIKKEMDNGEYYTHDEINWKN